MNSTTTAPDKYTATLTLSQENGSNSISVVVEWDPPLDDEETAPEAYVMMRKLVEGPISDMAQAMSDDGLQQHTVN